MAINTSLCDLFGIEHPVLLAPMAGVSGGVLAAAVSNAGGLGLIGGGYGDANWLTREFNAAGNARIGVGFILGRWPASPNCLILPSRETLSRSCSLSVTLTVYPSNQRRGDEVDRSGADNRPSTRSSGCRR